MRLNTITGLKTCSECRECLSPQSFWNDKSKVDGLERRCKACLKKRRNTEKYREYIRDYQKIYSRKNRILPDGTHINQFYRTEAIKILGGKCIVCGISDRRVLQFDHIKPVLRKSWQRNELTTSRAVSFSIFKHKKTDNIQLLCANCHCIKTIEDRKLFAPSLRKT